MDRRRSIRIAEELPFKIGHDRYEAEAVTVNISGHGALCLVTRDIPLMTQLKVGLKLPRTRALSMKGVVVRKEKDALSGKYFVAVYFSDIRPADRRVLEKYIEGRLDADA
jgi:c-di-GMP-binding flagellar brake protein YcgR